MARVQNPAANDLIRLVYVSSAAPALVADDLHSIEATSARRNADAGLTGFLLHYGASFYGVLEGPRARVFARMEAIIVDGRHSAVRVLREESVTSRRFDNWSFSSLPNAGRGTSAPSEEFIRSLARRLR
jgi:hypothetical protein